MRFKRVFLVIIDGLGVGSLPDSREFGDQNQSCLDDVLYKEDGAEIPTFLSLGLGNLTSYYPENNDGLAHYGKVRMLSKFKDSWAGHWELGGVYVSDDFAQYCNHGFSNEIIEKFEGITGYKVLANKAIIYREDAINESLEEHISNNKSVIILTEEGKETIRTFSIYAINENMSTETIYRLCERTAEILSPYRHFIGRIGARPFSVENNKIIVPHSKRKDYLIFEPPQKTLLTNLSQNGTFVYTTGKVGAMFRGIGINEDNYARTNDEVYNQLVKYFEKVKSGLVFATFNDMDCKYATAKDSNAWKNSLENLDHKINAILNNYLKNDDLLIITADGHGADPVYTGLHTREYSPIIVYNSNIKKGKKLDKIEFLHDIAFTIADNFSVPATYQGRSFLQEIL